MLCSTLISKLQELPQDAIVLTRGYENGYDSINELTVRTVGLTDANWYDGEYNDDSHYAKEKNITAITLGN